MSGNGDWKTTGKIAIKVEGSLSHPFVDEKNSLLYFVTDDLKGYGGTDIYVCDFPGLSNIKNLGPAINTPGNEMFPYVYNNNFYFASNGHPGMGGLDIYYVDISDKFPSQPENMGYPINSKKDDFAIVIEKYGNWGFFSSNRKSSGSDDLYQFIIHNK